MESALKWIALEVKSVDRENRSIEGYASTTMPDYEGEVILASAWKDSLRLWKKMKSRPKFLAYHQHRLMDGHSPVIGSIEWMEIVDDGLKFKAVFAETELGDEHLELYATGAMDAFSVGFAPQEREFDPEKMAKLLEKNGIDPKGATVSKVTKKAHILEVSAVVVGMNIGATVKAAREGNEYAASVLARLDAAADIQPDEDGMLKAGREFPAETVETERFEFVDEKAITSEDRSVISSEIRKLNMKDLVASHRRLHQLAARGAMLTGFSKSDMDWFHAQLEKELVRRAKEDERNPPEPSPLQWGSGKEAEGEFAEEDEVEEKHFPHRIREIIARARRRKKPKKDAVDEITVDVNIGETLSIIRDIAVAFKEGLEAITERIDTLGLDVQELTKSLKAGPPGAPVKKEQPKEKAEALSEYYLSGIAEIGKKVRAMSAK